MSREMSGLFKDIILTSRETVIRQTGEHKAVVLLKEETK